LERDDLWRQLNHAISLRSAEDQVLWSIFGVFWVANAILLVALSQNGQIPISAIGIVISVVGALLSIVWHQIQGRALGHVFRYEALVEKIERELAIPPNHATSDNINQEDYNRFLGRGIRTRQLMPICSLVASILWTLTLLFFLVRLICSNT